MLPCCCLSHSFCMLSLVLYHPLVFFSCSGDHRDLHSFPTRRSSDLDLLVRAAGPARGRRSGTRRRGRLKQTVSGSRDHLDRKSTRLNSSHLGISYAVFCLKKKKKKARIHFPSPRKR